MKHPWVLFLMGLLVLGGTARAVSTLYAATSIGPFKSTDSGVTWKQIILTTTDPALPGIPELHAIVVDPQTPSTLYAFARFGPTGQSLAFLKSTDSAATWSVVSKLTLPFFYSEGLLAIDPVKTNVLYTIDSNLGLEVTTDGGVTWTEPTIPKPADAGVGGTANQPRLSGVAADPNHSGVVYVIGSTSAVHPGKGYLLKSTDFGNTWSILTTTAGFGGRIFINPKNSQELYGTTADVVVGCPETNGGQCGIYKSTDGGQSWTELNIPASVVQNVGIDITPGLLYASAHDPESTNVYTSADGGNTWKTVFPDSTAIAANIGDIVRADPNAAMTAYAVGPSDVNVVSRTTDGGATWNAVKLLGCGSLTQVICGNGAYIYGLVVAPQAQGLALSPPAITSVINGASFLPGISQGSWMTIKGANLSTTTRIWTAADFIGNNLPTQLDGVGVTVDGKAAYVYYISPTQLNVLAPADAAVGPVQVQVTYAGQTSNSVSATESTFSPAMFMFDALGQKYVAAVRVDGQYIGPTNLYPGLTAPAHAGDTLQLYATGFGPTNPATTIGQTFVGAPPPASTVTATIGGVPATVQFAGLVSPGEYQFNIMAPAGLPPGDNPIVLSVGGVSTQPGAYLTVQ